MSQLAVLLGQAVDAIGVNPAALYIYGPLGIFCAFFMAVSMKLIALGAKLVTAIKEDGVEIRKELVEVRKDFKSVAHRMAGLERAMWADLVERDTVGMHTKAYARRAIAKIDAQLGDTPS